MEYIRKFKTEEEYKNSLAEMANSNFPRVSYVAELDKVFYDGITLFNFDFNNDYALILNKDG